MSAATDVRLITAGLEECEEVIERGLATFVEVGNALVRIRDQRLYRNEYRDFEVYCQVRWSMGRRRADQLITAAEVVTKLGTIVPTPRTESQARELAGLDTETAASVMGAAAEADSKITAASIREARERLLSPPVGNPTPEPESWPADDEDATENEWPVDEWPDDDEALTQADCEALDRELSDSELAREAEAVEMVVTPLRIPQPPKPAPLTEAERIARRDEQEHKGALRRQLGAIMAFLDGWDCASTLRISAWREEILAAMTDFDRTRFLAIERQLP